MKKFFTKMILLFFVSMLTVGALGATPDKDYLCFTAVNAGAKVKLAKSGSPTASLQYSTDGSKWTDYTFGNDITLDNVGDKVYFRNTKEAKDVTTFSEAGNRYYYFSFSDCVSVSGNIMSLVDKNVATTTLPCSNCFINLFKSCKNLTSAADLKMPATELKDHCYNYMFTSCTALKTAPAELPATTLIDYCYSNMFYGCSALETAPELKATKLIKSCYERMFYNCSKLNHVKVAFTKWPGTVSTAKDYKATSQWLYNAGTEATQTPVFECPEELDMTKRNESYVPANWNVPTGIEEIEINATDEASPISSPEGKDLYNLQGQKVSVNGFRGIVIKNGKRYLKR